MPEQLEPPEHMRTLLALLDTEGISTIVFTRDFTAATITARWYGVHPLIHVTPELARIDDGRLLRFWPLELVREEKTWPGGPVILIYRRTDLGTEHELPNELTAPE